MPRAHLNQANLAGATLFHADLDGADLTRADLAEANPENAHSLEGTWMEGVKGLTKAQLRACVEKGALIMAEESPAHGGGSDAGRDT